MPNFSKDYRVYTDSLIQLFEGIDDVVLRLSRGPIRFGHLAINKARMLNALYLWFLGQSNEVQDQIMAQTMPILKKHYEAEERLAIEPLSPDKTKPRGGTPRRIRADQTNGSNEAIG